MSTDAAALPDDVALCHELFREQADTIRQSQRKIEQLEHYLEQLLRRQLPEDLPRQRVEHQLTDAELPCPERGEQRHKIGEEVSEQLNSCPRSLKMASRWAKIPAIELDGYHGLATFEVPRPLECGWWRQSGRSAAQKNFPVRLSRRAGRREGEVNTGSYSSPRFGERARRMLPSKGDLEWESRCPSGQVSLPLKRS